MTALARTFWPIGDRHILPFFSHMSGGQYLLGDYDKDRDKFVVTAHGRVHLWGSIPFRIARTVGYA